MDGPRHIRVAHLCRRSRARARPCVAGPHAGQVSRAPPRGCSRRRGRGVDLRGQANGHTRPRGRGREEPGGVQLRADHLRRDAARLLRLGGPAGGHGSGRGPGLAVLPVVPPLLWSGVPRSRRQGAGPAVRAGLQRLDDRRMVRSCSRSLHPPDAHSPVGPGAGGRRGPPDRREGIPGDRLLREPGHARPSDHSGPGGPLGPPDGGLRGDARRSCACTSAPPAGGTRCRTSHPCW